MDFSLSTRWNVGRHRTGEAMIDEILALGFRHVELGFDLTLPLAKGVRARVAERAVTVTSVHNFCPVPIGAPRPHPELFTLASRDRAVRDSAVRHTQTTVRFAAEVGATAVVLHAGNVDMRPLTGELIALCARGRRAEPAYEKVPCG